MAVSEAEAIKDLTEEEVEDLKETFRTFDKVTRAMEETRHNIIFVLPYFSFLFFFTPFLLYSSDSTINSIDILLDWSINSDDNINSL